MGSPYSTRARVERKNSRMKATKATVKELRDLMARVRKLEKEVAELKASRDA